MENRLIISLLVSVLISLCSVESQATTNDYKFNAMAVKTISVPERFKFYNGVRNLSAMGELFVNPHPAGIAQLPKIAVSDGASNVVIEFKLSGDAAFAPNFAGKGAKLVSISHSVSEKWIVTLFPHKGSWKSSLIILNGTVVLEVPLVVTPPLPSDMVPNEKVFFTKGNDGAFGTITFDLNGDGKLDYLDDYIFMANYLAKKPPVKIADEPVKGESARQLPDYQVNQNPGAGPGIDPNSGIVIKPVFDADRHSPASRNERARKMKEQLR